MKRISVSFNDEQYAWLKEQAKAQGMSTSEFLRDLLNKEIFQTKDSQTKSDNANNELLERNLEVSYGIMGIVAWLMPAFFANQQSISQPLIEYFTKLSPTEVYGVMEMFGKHLFRNSEFLTALRDVPLSLDLNTKAFAGLSQEDWRIELTKEITKKIRSANEEQTKNNPLS